MNESHAHFVLADPVWGDVLIAEHLNKRSKIGKGTAHITECTAAVCDL